MHVNGLRLKGKMSKWKHHSSGMSGSPSHVLTTPSAWGAAWNACCERWATCSLRRRVGTAFKVVAGEDWLPCWSFPGVGWVTCSQTRRRYLDATHVLASAAHILKLDATQECSSHGSHRCGLRHACSPTVTRAPGDFLVDRKQGCQCVIWTHLWPGT